MTAQLDTGLQSLLMMASLHGIPADEAKLRHEFGQTSGLFDTNTILLAAKQLGFTARAVLQKPERLDKAPLPAVVDQLMREMQQRQRFQLQIPKSELELYKRPS